MLLSKRRVYCRLGLAGVDAPRTARQSAKIGNKASRSKLNSLRPSKLASSTGRPLPPQHCQNFGGCMRCLVTRASCLEAKAP